MRRHYKIGAKVTILIRNIGKIYQATVIRPGLAPHLRVDADGWGRFTLYPRDYTILNRIALKRLIKRRRKEAMNGNKITFPVLQQVRADAGCQ